MDDNLTDKLVSQVDRDDPGTVPGSPASEPDGEWLPLRQAADRLSIGHVALRKRAQRATVLARKDADGEWEVFVQAGAPPLGNVPAEEDTGTDRDAPVSVTGHGDRVDPDSTRVLPRSDGLISLETVRLVDLLRDQMEQVSDQARRLEELAAAAAMHQERARGEAERREIVERELDQTTSRLAAAEAKIAMLEAGPIPAPAGAEAAAPDHNDSGPSQYGIPTSPVTTEPHSEPVSWWRRLWGG